MRVGSEAKNSFEPTIPSYQYADAGNHWDSNWLVRVWFDLELRPDWATKSFAGDRDVSVELTVSDDELRAAAAELGRELESYPERP